MTNSTVGKQSGGPVAWEELVVQDLIGLVEPGMKPLLDGAFRPAVLHNHAFLDAVRRSEKPEPLGIAIERNDGLTSILKTVVFAEDCELSEANLPYVERLVRLFCGCGVDGRSQLQDPRASANT